MQQRRSLLSLDGISAGLGRVVWSGDVVDLGEMPMDITLGYFDMHQQVCIIMVVADALVPNRHQDISIHHADSTVIMVSYELYCISIKIALQASTH